MTDKPRGKWTRSPGHAKLKPADVRWIRKMYKPRDPKYGQAAMAERFGVTRMTISGVLARKTWRNVR